MEELRQYIELMVRAKTEKIIVSSPFAKSEEIKKIVVEKKNKFYQIAKYTEKQVFHENIDIEANDKLADRLAELISGKYKQVNGMSDTEEHIVLISKKGACSYKVKKKANDNIKSQSDNGHNRKKNYILEEGMSIAPLVDMGVFTSEGRVVNSMYDKYKQINRFIEIINDEVTGKHIKKLNVIDFGCGKSYLTFVVYYYLTEIMNIEVNMIGLDLKAEVIKKCNEAAKKYHYDNLHFELGDINGYDAPFDVDMVITLHACDMATDYALFNAIKWKAKLIFSVPCCQHELNKQMSPKTLSIMSKYGIIKERFAALAMDAIRGNILEYCGYKTQVMEFIDMEHTPKNILIRAVKNPMMPKSVREEALEEVRKLMEEFGFEPALWRMLELK